MPDLKPIGGQIVHLGWTQRSANAADIETRFASYNVKVEGATCDGVADDRAALNTLFTSLAALTHALVDVVGTPRIASALTVPANIHLRFLGGRLSIDAGVVVTVDGFVTAQGQVFSGAGTVTFGKKVCNVYPEWWGAVGDVVAGAGTNDSAAIQAAMNTGKEVLFGEANYGVGTALVTTQTVTMRGMGKERSTLTRLATVAAGSATVKLAHGASRVQDFFIDNVNRDGNTLEIAGNVCEIVSMELRRAGVGRRDLFLNGIHETYVQSTYISQSEGCVYASGCNQATFVRCEFHQNNGAGQPAIYLDTCIGFSFFGGISEPANTFAQIVDDSEGILFSGVYIESVDATARPIYEIGGPTPHNKIKGISIIGGRIHQNAGTGPHVMIRSRASAVYVGGGLQLSRVGATAGAFIQIYTDTVSGPPVEGVTLDGIGMHCPVAFTSIEITGDVPANVASANVSIRNIVNTTPTGGAEGQGTIIVRGSQVSVSETEHNVTIEAGATKVKLQNVSGTITNNSTSGVFDSTPLFGSTVLDRPSIADGAMQSASVAVAGASVGDFALVTTNVALPGDVSLTCNIRAANQVEFQLFNKSGAAYDPPSMTFYAMVFKRR